eukprot:731715-Pleurochrysis_carterae.AAC.2
MYAHYGAARCDMRTSDALHCERASLGVTFRRGLRLGALPHLKDATLEPLTLTWFMARAVACTVASCAKAAAAAAATATVAAASLVLGTVAAAIDAAAVRVGCGACAM